MRDPKRFVMQQHGSFTIEIKGRTLEICAYAAWNEQTSMKFKSAYMELAEKLCDKPWACLINLLEWELGTGEILQVGKELNAWSYEKHQRYSAIVCESSLHRQLIEKIQEPTKSIEHQYFTEMTPAQSWLASLALYA
ncbi:hypothetical protein [Paraglaciecola hydrolytica]|uniref:STAS/SEC14 domain-containing protein n=1 Tax=Paraglaciecola hydrolytica TaxID=1799789 RepID=A0A136A6Y7_9ALTE|nr:hypothetical protein [Paraglaciecola hydrolytica]KXI30992.1 hypothetical protein AX660_00590 [Paraglaciecola hydrolytica]